MACGLQHCLLPLVGERLKNHAVAPHPHPIRLDTYRIERTLTDGRYTRVLLGVATGPGDIRRSVAIKQLRPEAARDSNQVGSFQYEAMVASCLYHPNLVGMISAGAPAAGPGYMVLELVKGWTMRNLMGRARINKQPIPIAAALSLVHAIAAGMHYMHELSGTDGRSLGLVHRDLAADNVMISAHGQVKVLDFGSATAAAIERVAPRRLERTTAYTAPELLRGDPVDRRADIYSLGVLLHQLVHGIGDDRGNDLVQLLERSRQTDPGSRYSSAQDLQVAIEAVASGRGHALSNVCLGMYARRLFAARAGRGRLPGLIVARDRRRAGPTTLGRTRVRVRRKRADSVLPL